MWEKTQPNSEIRTLIQKTLTIEHPTVLKFENSSSTNKVYKIQSTQNNIILKYQEDKYGDIQGQLEAVIAVQQQLNQNISKYVPQVIGHGRHNDKYYYVFYEEKPGEELTIESYPKPTRRKITHELGQFIGLLHNQSIKQSGFGEITTKHLTPKYKTQYEFIENRTKQYQKSMKDGQFKDKHLARLKKFIDKLTDGMDTSQPIYHIEDFTTTNAVFDTDSFTLNAFIDWDWLIGCTQSFALINSWYRLTRYKNISLKEKQLLWNELWDGYTKTRTNPGNQPQLSSPHIKTYIAFNILDEFSDFDKWNRGKTTDEKSDQKEELYQMIDWITDL